MGSPLTFFKLQQAPALWMLDRAGFGRLLDDPEAHQEALLPLVRLGAIWVWVVALGLTAWWAYREHGPRAMVFAAWLFALSPNLIAHGALVTMELPLVAGAAGMYVFWSRFLETGRRRWFLATAALGGLVFSCKFTAVLLPPLFAVAWWLERWRKRGVAGAETCRLGRDPASPGSTGVATGEPRQELGHDPAYKTEEARSVIPALPLTKGELEGVPSVAAVDPKNPPLSPLSKGGSRKGGIRERLASAFPMTLRILGGMLVFGLVMVAANVAVTRGARLPISEQHGVHPLLEKRLGPESRRAGARWSKCPCRRTGPASCGRCNTSAPAGPAIYSASAGCAAGGITSSSAWP